MKRMLCGSLASLLLILSASVGLTTANSERSALDDVPRFLDQVETAGFSWQEGKFTFFDLIKEVCEGGGRDFSAMGNDPWPNAYYVLQMPNPDDIGYELPFAMN